MVASCTTSCRVAPKFCISYFSLVWSCRHSHESLLTFTSLFCDVQKSTGRYSWSVNTCLQSIRMGQSQGQNALQFFTGKKLGKGESHLMFSRGCCHSGTFGNNEPRNNTTLLLFDCKSHQASSCSLLFCKIDTFCVVRSSTVGVRQKHCGIH